MEVRTVDEEAQEICMPAVQGDPEREEQDGQDIPDQGSNNCEVEESIMFNWEMLLQKAEPGELRNRPHLVYLMYVHAHIYSMPYICT